MNFLYSFFENLLRSNCNIFAKSVASHGKSLREPAVARGPRFGRACYRRSTFKNKMNYLILKNMNSIPQIPQNNKNQK